MMPARDPHMLLYALLLVLPLSALIARRVPIARTLWMLLSWATIFGVGLFVLSQRERYDPYLARIAGVLKLDDQSVVGSEVRIRMAPDGHFWARARLNGLDRRMLIDSGATLTALSTETASAAGLDVRNSLFPMIVRTANGSIDADVSSISQLRLGTIRGRRLAGRGVAGVRRHRCARDELPVPPEVVAG